MFSAKDKFGRLVKGKVYDLIPNFISKGHRDAGDLIVQLSTCHLLISVRLSCLLRSLYYELVGETSPTVGFWWGILDSGVSGERIRRRESEVRINSVSCLLFPIL